jgi:hypothetical protein
MHRILDPTGLAVIDKGEIAGDAHGFCVDVEMNHLVFHAHRPVMRQ